MKEILISGASVSAGFKLPNGIDNPNLFVTRLAKTLYKNVNITNISVVGIDNKEIFLQTQFKMLTNDYSDVFVCWQNIPRVGVNVGLELYKTTIPLISVSGEFNDINLVANQTFYKKKIAKLQDYLLRYYNLHWEIRDLIMYVNNLQYIAKIKNINLHFINYMLPWPAHYFKHKNWNFPSELDSFTQNILNSDIRDDHESKLIYDMIHTEYSNYGGICDDLWLNLYEPLRDIQIDNIDLTDTHPGPKSQDKFFDFLKSRL